MTLPVEWYFFQQNERWKRRLWVMNIDFDPSELRPFHPHSGHQARSEKGHWNETARAVERCAQGRGWD